PGRDHFDAAIIIAIVLPIPNVTLMIGAANHQLRSRQTLLFNVDAVIDGKNFIRLLVSPPFCEEIFKFRLPERMPREDKWDTPSRSNFPGNISSIRIMPVNECWLQARFSRERNHSVHEFIKIRPKSFFPVVASSTAWKPDNPALVVEWL